eukprot:360753-Chlamydomonas_euryale.AAC.3
MEYGWRPRAAGIFRTVWDRVWEVGNPVPLASSELPNCAWEGGSPLPLASSGLCEAARKAGGRALAFSGCGM